MRTLKSLWGLRLGFACVFLLIAAWGCAGIGAEALYPEGWPPPAIANIPVFPQRTIVWHPVTPHVLAEMKSAGNPAWKDDPGPVVENMPDKCVIYGPEPTCTTDVMGFWRLGDGIRRCWFERAPLKVADLQKGIKDSMARLPGRLCTRNYEIFPEYRVNTVTMTPVLIPDEQTTTDLVLSLDPAIFAELGNYQIFGMALPDTSQEPYNCLVLVPEVASGKDVWKIDTWGHEALHCFRGAWHPNDQSPGGVLSHQDVIQLLRSMLQDILNLNKKGGRV